MILNEKEVRHIAQLARIELSEKEITLYSRQLTELLQYVAQLGEVETQGMPMVYSWDEPVVYLRKDEAKACSLEERDSILEQAPRQSRGYIQVKSVFE